ncbi:unnamed protein product [Discula destructiva]
MTHQPSRSTGPGRKWIWVSLVLLLLLCAAAVHRRQLPFPGSKDLFGYDNALLSPAPLDEQLRNTDDNVEGEYEEAADEVISEVDNGPNDGEETTDLMMRRSVALRRHAAHTGDTRS